MFKTKEIMGTCVRNLIGCGEIEATIGRIFRIRLVNLDF